MKEHRTLTIAGAGSALAACLALFAVTMIPTPATTVQAATIFASFREAVGNAFELEFGDLGAEGVRTNGRVMVITEPGSQDSAAFASSAQAAYLEVDAVADETAEQDLQGLDVHVALSLVPDQEWAFVKLKQLPHEVLEDEPIARMVQAMAMNGLLLDLDGLLNRKEMQDILGELSIHKHLEEATGQRNEITIRVDADTPGKSKEKVHERIRTQIHHHHHVDPAEQLAGFTEQELTKLALDVFTGKASAEQFRSLVSLLEQAASDVRVEETQPGLHVLTASGFNFEDDEEAQRMLGRLVLQIAYQEGLGLAWASLENIGQYDGWVRFQMVDASINDPCFNRERFVSDPAVQRFNLGSMLGFFEQQ